MSEVDVIPTPAKHSSGRWRVLLGALGWIAGAVVILGTTRFLSPFLGAAVPSANRTLYFKLPIEGARFHWRFLDRAAFLSGELTLRIINKDRDQTLVVFRDGKIQDGWEAIDDTRPNGGIYFGFASTDRFPTKADDSLVITLTATKDLLGQGPYREGVLKAGVWQRTGAYSSIYGERWNPIDYIVQHGDPPIVFMECWRDEWPITITKSEGWSGGAEPKAVAGLLGALGKPRGTTGRECGSHS
ncbi:MAG TPA: hypothetical protein VFN22_04045 [Gemmatimonadales bacterium]|nr:hypothetical protein [Gemmatimonadales bacterium]